MAKIATFFLDAIGLIAFTIILSLGLAYRKTMQVIQRGNQWRGFHFFVTFTTAIAIGTVAGYFTALANITFLGLPWDYLAAALFTLASAGIFEVGIDVGDYMEKNSQEILRDVHSAIKRRITGGDDQKLD